MDRLIDYHIISSHNTYLEGNQLTGKTNIDCYINFLKLFGGGCIEIDIIKIDTNQLGEAEIIVGHYKTLSGELLLSSIFEAIREYLNDVENKKLGPVIISFDNKYIKTKERL
jgi:phosphatidylinositol phospholipase C delta